MPYSSVLSWLACPRGASRLSLLRGGFRLVSAVLTLGALAGCTIGPDFTAPDLSPSATFLPGGDPGFLLHGAAADQQDRTHEWWAAFKPAKVRSLVEYTLIHNADLEAAAASVRLAQANAAVQTGAYFPLVTGAFDTNRQKIAQGTVVSPLQSNASLFSLSTAQLNIAYNLDWLGGVRRSVEGANAVVDAQAFQREALELTLAANVATSAVQEASLRAQIDVTKEMIEIQQRFLNVLQRQNAAGQIGMADVAAQETALAQTRLLLLPLEKQLEQQRNLISVLSGRYPSQRPPESFTLKDFRELPIIPRSTTSDLFRNRPDIRAAEAQLRASNAAVGVAMANRFPQITLTGQIGSSSSDMSKLFSANNGFWTLAGGALAPIFDAGILANKQVAAEEGYHQTLAQYRSTVLGAFQNVADTLRALQADERMIEAARAATESANRNLSLVRKQVEGGQVSLPALLSAQQAYLQTSITKVQAEASRCADVFALLQALGRPWWPSPDTHTKIVMQAQAVE